MAYAVFIYSLVTYVWNPVFQVLGQTVGGGGGREGVLKGVYNSVAHQITLNQSVYDTHCKKATGERATGVERTRNDFLAEMSSVLTRAGR